MDPIRGGRRPNVPRQRMTAGPGYTAEIHGLPTCDRGELGCYNITFDVFFNRVHKEKPLAEALGYAGHKLTAKMEGSSEVIIPSIINPRVKVNQAILNTNSGSFWASVSMTVQVGDGNVDGPYILSGEVSFLLVGIKEHLPVEINLPLI